MTSRPRRMLAATVAVLAACAAVLVAPSPAVAAAGTITCAGTTQIRFQPGLTFKHRPVQATETTILNPCVSTVPGITSGRYTEVYTANWSCLTVAHTSTATYPFVWNDGTHSTVSINYAVHSAGSLVISEAHGTVVDGVLEGAAVLATWTYAQPNLLECLFFGITEQIGPVTLTITAAQ